MIKPIESTSDIGELYAQMGELYGEQSHIPHFVLLTLAQIYPDLFLLGKDSTGKICSHLIALPLNKKGHEKMTDDSSYEADFTLDDFVLARQRGEEIFIFIYSIYGRSDFQAAKMIKSLYRAIEALGAHFHKDSLLFAECVSREGQRISERMGLVCYCTYVFDGEELFLYQSSLNNFLTHNKTRSSLSK